MYVWLQSAYMSPPLPFLQYSSIPHLQNSVFNKHWEYFKISKSPILTRSIKIHTLQLSLKVYEIDPFFYLFMFHKYHLCFTFIKTYLTLCEFQCYFLMQRNYNFLMFMFEVVSDLNDLFYLNPMPPQGGY